jgi:CHAD domain-containing protein
MHDDAVRRRAYEISQADDAGTPAENWARAEQEFAVVHDYDTLDRDLEQLGMTLSRLPSEAGVTWRLTLPRGERVEAWEPGTDGLAPPPEIMRLTQGVVSGKELVSGPPASRDGGAVQLREMLGAQRIALLAHDPGTRFGADPENLHQHRVAARRARAFVRATRAYLDPEWQRTLAASLRQLGEATGPVRDLDVLVEHVQEAVGDLDAPDREAGAGVLARLEAARAAARRRLVDALDADAYRFVLTRLRFPPRLAAGIEAVPLERIARKEFRRLARQVEQLGRHPAEGQIHGLRIALKRARYATELSAPEGAAARRFLADARVLQDLLGEHQDAVVAEQLLRAATVDDERTAAAFAAGRIAERQRDRRLRVRERLPAAWKRLRKSGARLA